MSCGTSCATSRMVSGPCESTLPPVTHPTSSFEADPATARALAAGEEVGRGARLYDDSCAACHHTDGRGATRALPTIAGNSSVLAADPTSIIHLILQGSQHPGTAAAPSRYARFRLALVGPGGGRAGVITHRRSRLNKCTIFVKRWSDDTGTNRPTRNSPLAPLHREFFRWLRAPAQTGSDQALRTTCRSRSVPGPLAPRD
jgi:hypothetical protein